MNVLIFGASGSIGNYIFNKLQNNGNIVYGTTTSMDKITDKIIFVNSNDTTNLLNIPKIDAIIWAHGYNFSDNT